MMAFTELASTNPSETRKFLEKTFGWKFDSVQMPTGPYLTFQNPKGTTVGIRATQKSEIPGGTNYVLVENLDEAERNVRKKGGQIVLPRTDIPGMGSFFWFKIPSGPIMACWQDSKKNPDLESRCARSPRIRIGWVQIILPKGPFSHRQMRLEKDASLVQERPVSHFYLSFGALLRRQCVFLRELGNASSTISCGRENIAWTQGAYFRSIDSFFESVRESLEISANLAQRNS